MLPVMIPLFRRLDLDQDVGLFSVFTRLEGYVTVAALGPVQPGRGRITVDGTELTRWDAVAMRGVTLLFLPVGEVAREYGASHRVVLEGFCAPNGRRYRRCAFRAFTGARREHDPAFEEHDAAALEAAREGMVLLRNENGALPLAPDETLNCLGTAQHWWRSSAAGASRINPRHRPSFHQAVAEHSRFHVNPELAEYYRDPRHTGAPEAELLERARQRSDAALVFIGRHSGEMMDSRDIPGEYRLSAGELDMLRAARATFRRVVVVLNTGGPLDMTWLREIDVDAILFTGFAGMLSARALVEILDGRVNPSGHLPDTWPWRFGDDPVSRNFPTLPPDSPHVPEDAIGVRVYYEEDVYMGYRYFDTFGVPVAFPFGHGLSYTRFELTPVGLEKRGDALRVSVRVANAGDAPGKAVVQLYAAPPRGRLERSAHGLVGFEKTAPLVPGASQTLELDARLEDMAAFDEAQGAWVLEAGEYGLSVGQSLAERVPCGSVRLEARVLRRVERLGAPVEDFKRLTRADPTVDGSRSRIVPLGQQIAVPAARRAYRPAPLKRRGGRVRWAEAKRDPARLEAFVAGLSLFELCRLNVCAGARWMPWQDGMAGHTPRLSRRGLPSFCASDANAGLNLKRRNVGFPASSVVAATFNREIARTVGRVVAEECPGHGVDLVLAPAMNLHRSPLCGRHAEYFSEDPYLTGELAGWHGKGLEEAGIGCCYKHLFCNNAELGRLGSHSVVSEQALRELYLRAFQIAFRVHSPRSVMTSYNALNGLYPGENAALLQDLLRGEWGFEGFVMSDWGSDRTVDALEMIRAGNSWITPGGPAMLWRVWRAARRGDIDRAVLENNVLWLLKGMKKD